MVPRSGSLVLSTRQVLHQYLSHLADLCGQDGTTLIHCSTGSRSVIIIYRILPAVKIGHLLTFLKRFSMMTSIFAFTF